MLQVPKPLKSLFNTFPLATYAAVANTTPQNDAFIEESKFYFETKDPQNISSDSVFTLGVHNVVPLQIAKSVRYVPTDPVSFGLALVLCRKNSLCLPQGRSSLKHSIMCLAYHASPDNQLPLLIEDEKDSRNLRSGNNVSSSIASKYFVDCALDYMVNNMVEHELYDAWIMALLCDLPSMPETFSKIFNHKDELFISENATTAALISLLLEIPSWRTFRVRHPHLFHESKAAATIRVPAKAIKGSVIEAFSTADYRALERTYEDKLHALEPSLNLLVSYIEDEPSDIVRLKLVAYVVSVDSMLQGSRLGQLISKKFGALVKQSYETIKKEF